MQLNSKSCQVPLPRQTWKHAQCVVQRQCAQIWYNGHFSCRKRLFWFWGFLFCFCASAFLLVCFSVILFLIPVLLSAVPLSLPLAWNPKVPFVWNFPRNSCFWTSIASCQFKPTIYLLLFKQTFHALSTSQVILPFIPILMFALLRLWPFVVDRSWRFANLRKLAKCKNQTNIVTKTLFHPKESQKPVRTYCYWINRSFKPWLEEDESSAHRFQPWKQAWSARDGFHLALPGDWTSCCFGPLGVSQWQQKNLSGSQSSFAANGKAIQSGWQFPGISFDSYGPKDFWKQFPIWCFFHF